MYFWCVCFRFLSNMFWYFGVKDDVGLVERLFWEDMPYVELGRMVIRYVAEEEIM